MSRRIAHALVLATMGLALDAGASTVGFDGSNEGWTSFGNGGQAVAWVSAGGNPGGYAQLDDVVNSWAYFAAPASFRAQALLGSTLVFDLRSIQDGRFPNQFSVRTVLVGAGLTLISEATLPTPDWAHYEFDLDLLGGWRIHANTDQEYNAGNAAPTAAQFASVLGSLSQLLISADHTNGNTLSNSLDRTELDNVGFVTPLLVPEPATPALLLAALAAAGWARRRRGA